MRITRFGPIITDTPSYSQRSEKPLALKWTTISETSDIIGSLLAVDRATDWQSFRQALSLLAQGLAGGRIRRECPHPAFRSPPQRVPGEQTCRRIHIEYEAVALQGSSLEDAVA